MVVTDHVNYVTTRFLCRVPRQSGDTLSLQLVYGRIGYFNVNNIFNDALKDILFGSFYRIVTDTYRIRSLR